MDETPKAFNSRRKQPVVENLEDEEVKISPSKTDKLRRGYDEYPPVQVEESR